MDLRSSLTETKSSRKESSFLAKQERLISSHLLYLKNLCFCTTGTPRLECVLTNISNCDLNTLALPTVWDTTTCFQPKRRLRKNNAEIAY